jgi:hypothetical protein
MHSDHLRTANQGCGKKLSEQGRILLIAMLKNTTMHGGGDRFRLHVHFTSRTKRKGMGQLNTLTKDVERMEMQIGQLITIIANLNDRINHIEDNEREKKIRTIRKIALADHL